MTVRVFHPSSWRLLNWTGKDFNDLKEAHVTDYQSLFNRFEIDLGGHDLISSVRGGGHPPNLQGMWNDMLYPPWKGKYTTNINCEMNFWPAEPLNLAKCHTTLFDMIDELPLEGRKTARAH